MTAGELYLRHRLQEITAAEVNMEVYGVEGESRTFKDRARQMRIKAIKELDAVLQRRDLQS